MGDRLRILHILRAPVGGLFRHVRDVARVQSNLGHEVGVVCDSLAANSQTETALAAIESGVRAVVILDGRAPNAPLLELFTEHGAGSIIRKG